MPQHGYNSLANLTARRKQRTYPVASTSTDRLHAIHSTPTSDTNDDPHCIDITDILIQLRIASGDERELQIIYDTIAVQAAAPAWTIREGIIYYSDRIYLPTTSPLLQDALESLDTTSPNLLAVGFHSATSDPALQLFSSSILLLEPWPTHPLPSSSIVFFDNSGQQFISINDVNITIHQESGRTLISSAYDTTGDTLFGTMWHFDTTPTFQAPSTVCRRFRGIINVR
jgi:hypothetical protein